MTEAELTSLKAAATDLHAKVATASDPAAAAKQATANKNECRHAAELLVRGVARRIKAHQDYTPGQGASLGIEGTETKIDLSSAKPDLSGVDLTGGKVSLSFSKQKSDGINIYGQREGDVDWVLLSRATVSPFMDNRPLLAAGKPELRRYSAVYMAKDSEIGQFSDDLVVNCAP